jgi:hypothetical protein
MVGDGCRYCQPQTYIDVILDLLEELENNVEELEEEIRERGV